MRLSSPVVSTAAPIINPPKTNQNAPEMNPEKTIWGLATASSIASKKKMRIVTCSGITPVARAPTTSKTSAAEDDSSSEKPKGAIMKIVIEVRTISPNIKKRAGGQPFFCLWSLLNNLKTNDQR
tara:strand:- start:602 stop:973 length:372 start_codon:yes stop_codon:yes gene_type:complete